MIFQRKTLLTEAASRCFTTWNNLCHGLPNQQKFPSPDSKTILNKVSLTFHSTKYSCCPFLSRLRHRLTFIRIFRPAEFSIVIPEGSIRGSDSHNSALFFYAAYISVGKGVEGLKNETKGTPPPTNICYSNTDTNSYTANVKSCMQHRRLESLKGKRIYVACCVWTQFRWYTFDKVKRFA